MSLKDDLGALPRGPRTFKQWLQSAPTEDMTAALDALRDTTILTETLIGVFRKNGIPMTPETVKSYRDAG